MVPRGTFSVPPGLTNRTCSLERDAHDIPVPSGPPPRPLPIDFAQNNLEARRRAIIPQFIIEAVVISFAGVLLGLAMS